MGLLFSYPAIDSFKFPHEYFSHMDTSSMLVKGCKIQAYASEQEGFFIVLDSSAVTWGLGFCGLIQRIHVPFSHFLQQARGTEDLL